MYRVITKWTGWLGGWGSESDIANLLTEESSKGWRLWRIDSKRCFWMWWIPRIKTIFIFEKS